MPRHLLTAKQIVAARDRDIVDGEGLIVRVKESSCTAVLRFTSPVSHKRRELGLGLVSRDSLRAAGETLVAARVAAEDAGRLIRDGLDPIDVRDAKRTEAGAREEAAKAATKSAATTLRRFARNYHDEHVEPLRSTRHAQQWINSIERNVPGKFLDRPIDSITPFELLDTLVPIMRRVPETGSRIYRRLSTVFDAAVIGGLVAANPAGPIQARRPGRAYQLRGDGLSQAAGVRHAATCCARHSRAVRRVRKARRLGSSGNAGVKLATSGDAERLSAEGH